MLDQVYTYVHVSELSRVIINFTSQPMKWMCLASYIRQIENDSVGKPGAINLVDRFYCKHPSAYHTLIISCALSGEVFKCAAPEQR